MRLSISDAMLLVFLRNTVGALRGNVVCQNGDGGGSSRGLAALLHASLLAELVLPAAVHLRVGLAACMMVVSHGWYDKRLRW
jgi:hypothetical protein